MRNCRIVTRACPAGLCSHSSVMTDSYWILGVRVAGALHFATLILAANTPIPPGWDENLAQLPAMHRRFAVVQNLTVGACIAALGLLSLGLAPALVAGTPLARAVCLMTAVFWGARAAAMPWLAVGPALTTLWLRLGHRLLLAECTTYALAYGWLALRPGPG